MSEEIYPDRNELEKEYTRLIPEYSKMLDEFVHGIEETLSIHDVRSSVKFRVKSFSSYYRKLLHIMKEKKETETLPSIYDIVGIRIVCPFLENLRQAEEVLQNNYTIRDVEWKGANYSFKEFGYQSIHLLIELPADIENRYTHLQIKFCEVQIRTILQDAWSEVEHELVYKADFTPYDEPLKRKLAALNANLSLSDIIFQEIRDYQRQLHLELKKRRLSFIDRVEKEKPEFIPANAHSSKRSINESTYNFNSGDVDQLLLDALHAHNNKEYHHAISLYNTIIEQNVKPNIKSLILVHRGMAFFAASKYHDALKNFEEAAEIEPENSKVFYYLGIVYRVMDNTPEALHALQRSLEIYPYYFDCLFALAQVLYEINDYPGAIEYCNKALKIVPNSQKVIEFREHVSGKMNL